MKHFLFTVFFYVSLVLFSLAQTNDPEVYKVNDSTIIPRTSEYAIFVIPLKWIPASELISNLTPLADPTSIITANAECNSLIISDTSAAVKRFVDIIRILDVPQTEPSVIKIFKLRYSTSDGLATVINQLYVPSLFATAMNDFLIIKGSQYDVDNISIIINKLDASIGSGYETRIFKLNNSSPSDMVNEIPTLFVTSSGGVTNRVDSVIVVPDDRTHSIIVKTDSKIMGKIENLVTELDADPRGTKRIYVIQINNDRINQAVADLLNSINSK